MKTMKWGFALLLTVLALTTSFAQPRGGGQRGQQNLSVEERAQQATERLTKQLELSEVQAAQVFELEQRFGTQSEAIRQNTELNRQEKREQMEVQQEQKQTELQAILSDEQWVKFEEMKKNRGERPQGRNRGGNDSRGGK